MTNLQEKLHEMCGLATFLYVADAERFHSKKSELMEILGQAASACDPITSHVSSTPWTDRPAPPGKPKWEAKLDSILIYAKTHEGLDADGFIAGRREILDALNAKPADPEYMTGVADWAGMFEDFTGLARKNDAPLVGSELDDFNSTYRDIRAALKAYSELMNAKWAAHESSAGAGGVTADPASPVYNLETPLKVPATEKEKASAAAYWGEKLDRIRVLLHKSCKSLNNLENDEFNGLWDHVTRSLERYSLMVAESRERAQLKAAEARAAQMAYKSHAQMERDAHDERTATKLRDYAERREQTKELRRKENADRLKGLAEISLGNVVYLKSGGPAMTVSAIMDDDMNDDMNDDRVGTTYFNGTGFVAATFRPEELTRTEPGK